MQYYYVRAYVRVAVGVLGARGGGEFDVVQCSAAHSVIGIMTSMSG